MRFFVVIAAIVSIASAAPEVKKFPSFERISVSEATDACGKNLNLKCCNRVPVDTSGSGTAPQSLGLVGNLLEGLSLLDECSQITIPAVSGIEHLLKNQCSGQVACCTESPNVEAGGIINLGVPCLAIGSILQ